MRRYRDMDNYILELLKDPKEAEAYLNASIDVYMEDGNTAAFCIALEHLVKSRCPVAEFSEKNSINRKQLYRIFRNEINPSMETVFKILKSLGFKIQFSLTGKIAC
jgi:probable addiction module antidote protein